MKNSQLQSILELLFAASLWGFGFIAAIWTLESFQPITSIVARFGLATIVGFAITFMIPSLRSRISKQDFKNAILPGFFLFSTLWLQTWGLQHTTATKSSFITCLYVLIVPVIEWLFAHKKLPWIHWVSVSMALVGTALMVHLNLKEWNLGDTLTLGCAIMAALHILSIGWISQKVQSTFHLNIFQTAVAGFFALIAWVISSESIPTSLTSNALMGLLLLSCGSTLIAFTLQIRAQKKISASLASLIFLLESPFAMVFAFVLLKEQISFMQLSGAILILASCTLAVKNE